MSVVATAALCFRTIWISDTHLGTPGCQAGRLLEFLRRTESDYLYLVGDIIDGWQLRRRWYGHQSHNDVVQKILRKARKDTAVVYVAGNHDEVVRHFLRLPFGGIAIRGGDWVESLTALVEKPDGTLKILHWQELAGADPTPDTEESFIDAHPDRY